MSQQSLLKIATAAAQDLCSAKTYSDKVLIDVGLQLSDGSLIAIEIKEDNNKYILSDLAEAWRVATLGGLTDEEFDEIIKENGYSEYFENGQLVIKDITIAKLKSCIMNLTNIIKEVDVIASQKLESYKNSEVYKALKLFLNKRPKRLKQKLYRINGKPITGEEMLRLIERGEPAACSYIDDVNRAAIRTVQIVSDTESEDE